jgi:hypothetical protein
MTKHRANLTVGQLIADLQQFPPHHELWLCLATHSFEQDYDPETGGPAGPRRHQTDDNLRAIRIERADVGPDGPNGPSTCILAYDEYIVCDLDGNQESYDPEEYYNICDPEPTARPNASDMATFQAINALRSAKR